MKQSNPELDSGNYCELPLSMFNKIEQVSQLIKKVFKLIGKMVLAFLYLAEK